MCTCASRLDVRIKLNAHRSRRIAFVPRTFCAVDDYVLPMDVGGRARRRVTSRARTMKFSDDFFENMLARGGDPGEDDRCRKQ